MLNFRGWLNTDVIIIGQIALINKPFDTFCQHNITKQSRKTTVAHTPRCSRYPQFFTIREHLPKFLVSWRHAMMSLIYDDKVELFPAHHLIMPTTHEGLDRSYLYRLVQIQFLSAYNHSMRDIPQFLTCLPYQFPTMGHNQDLRFTTMKVAPSQDILNNRSKDNRLACTSRHLKHHIVYFIPKAINIVFHFRLVRTQAHIIRLNMRESDGRAFEGFHLLHFLVKIYVFICYHFNSLFFVPTSIHGFLVNIESPFRLLVCQCTSSF